jgi:glutathione S-transferase
MAPALEMYALAATLLGLHLLALALWTGTARVMNKVYVNPEDAKMNKAEAAEAEHPAVSRAKRAHQNALENAVPFFAIGYLYAASAPSKQGAVIYFGTFATMRILHSVFYLWGRQPFRTLTFGIGVLTTIGMAVHVIRAAL